MSNIYLAHAEHRPVQWTGLGDRRRTGIPVDTPHERSADAGQIPPDLARPMRHASAFRRAARRQSDRGPRPGSDPGADEMNLGVQITGVFPGTARNAYRFQEWPAGAGPSRLALPRCPARLAEALARFWCPLSAMVTAVGWSAGGSPARTDLLNRHGIGPY